MLGVVYYRVLSAVFEIIPNKNVKRSSFKQSKKCLGVEHGSILIVNLNKG